MKSLARLDADQEWLEPIPGQPPSLITPPPGCAFHPRCAHSQGRAPVEPSCPSWAASDGGAHLSACHFADELTVTHVRVAAAAGEP